MLVEGNGLFSANGHAVNEETTFKLIKADIPFLPDWLIKRPSLNHNSLVSWSKHYVDKTFSQYHKYEETPKPLGSYPIDIQENFLIEDLLYTMISIEGTYVKIKKKENEYDHTIR